MKVTVLVLAAFALVSCSTFDIVDALARSGQSDAKTSADAKSSAPEGKSASQMSAAAKAEWAKYSAPAPSSKTYPAGEGASSLASASLKAGAWAAYRTLENGQPKAVIKLALAGKEGDAWIYEIVSISPTEISAFQEAVTGLDAVLKTGDASQGKILWVKVMGKDGKVDTLSEGMLSMSGKAYQSMLTANSARFSSAVTAGGAVTVPAGTFAGTWKVEATSSQGRNSEPSTAWTSTLVPVWHLIKSVNQGGTRVFELVDFGASGYQSVFP